MESQTKGLCKLLFVFLAQTIMIDQDLLKGLSNQHKLTSKIYRTASLGCWVLKTVLDLNNVKLCIILSLSACLYVLIILV